MSAICEPSITEIDKDASDYTQVKFEPDLKIFGMKRMSDDVYNLLKKRVYDLAGCTPSTVQVYLNGKKLTKINNFQNYVDLYFPKQNQI